MIDYNAHAVVHGTKSTAAYFYSRGGKLAEGALDKMVVPTRNYIRQY